MTTAFQSNILRYIVSSSDGKDYLPLLNIDCFDLPEVKLVFDIIEKYFEKYKTIPIGEFGKINILEFFDQQSKVGKGVDDEAYRIITAAINEIYVPNFQADTPIIREEIIKFAKRKQTKQLMRDEIEKSKTGDDHYFDELVKKFVLIAAIGKDALMAEKNRGGFLFADYGTHTQILPEGKSTFLKKLNKMTSAGGFHTPQLILIIGEPKSFKTGVALNIAMEYTRTGLKGYIADFENGIMSMKGRMYQQMLRATFEEMKDGKLDHVLREMVPRWKARGGDIVNDYYLANVQTADDVDANLQYLFDTFGWTPDYILWDYPDLMAPVDKSIKEKRLRISAVYHDIIRVHNKWNCFGFAISQVNKGALDKEVITMGDLGEDFGKNMNAHAGFAICATPEEREANLARLVSVFQRQGERHSEGNQCYIEIDAARGYIKEILAPGEEEEEIPARGMRHDDPIQEKPRTYTEGISNNMLMGIGRDLLRNRKVSDD